MRSMEWIHGHSSDLDQKRSCLLTARGPIHCWKRWDQFLRRSRIRIVVRIQIIIAQIEWSSAKKAKTILNRWNRRQRRTFLWFGECSGLQHCKHLYSWGKNYSDHLHSIKNTEDPTMKQMFDISEKLISEQSDEIYGVRTISWETLHGSICLGLVMKKSSVSCTQRSTYFQSLYYSVERWTRTLNPVLHGKTDWRGSKVFRHTEPCWADGIRVEYLPRIHHVAAQSRSSRVTVEIEWNTREFYRKEHLHVDVQRHLMGSKDNKIECESNAQLVSLFAKKIRSRTMVISRSWFSENSPQGGWDKMAERMMVTLAESGHPVFRATSPLSRGVLKSKGGGKLSIHYCADQETITIVVCTITFVNQLSLYGAVAEMCEEYESFSW